MTANVLSKFIKKVLVLININVSVVRFLLVCLSHSLPFEAAMCPPVCQLLAAATMYTQHSKHIARVSLRISLTNSCFGFWPGNVCDNDTNLAHFG